MAVVFQSHPRKEIREDFFSILQSGNVTVWYDTEHSTGTPGAIGARKNTGGELELVFGVEDAFFGWDVKRPLGYSCARMEAPQRNP